jgi:hypothetical protein
MRVTCCDVNACVCAFVVVATERVVSAYKRRCCLRCVTHSLKHGDGSRATAVRRVCETMSVFD